MADLVERYRDHWLLVVDKPSGLDSQPARKATTNVYDLLNAANPYVGLHHRLDRDASGLILLTLHKKANWAIAKGFREHTIRRVYRAVVSGELTDAVWDRPVDGKNARTHATVLGTGAGFSAVEVRLETGRKHQIRQHAAMAGTPVLGDRMYGGDVARAWPRLALHACRLELEHPVTGEPLVVESPVPEDLAEVWQMAGGV